METACSPLVVRFTHDRLQDTFRRGEGQRRHTAERIDTVIDRMRNATPEERQVMIDNFNRTAPLEVFRIYDQLYSISNRRLFMWRVLANMGIVGEVRVVIHSIRSPRMSVTLPHNRLPKWASSLTTRCTGVRVEFWANCRGSVHEGRHSSRELVNFHTRTLDLRQEASASEACGHVRMLPPMVPWMLPPMAPWMCPPCGIFVIQPPPVVVPQPVQNVPIPAPPGLEDITPVPPTMDNVTANEAPPVIVIEETTEPAEVNNNMQVLLGPCDEAGLLFFEGLTLGMKLHALNYMDCLGSHASSKNLNFMLSNFMFGEEVAEALQCEVMSNEKAILILEGLPSKNNKAAFLEQCILQGKPDIMKSLLVGEGQDNVFDPDEICVPSAAQGVDVLLCSAAHVDNAICLCALLDAGASIELRASNGNTALLEAIKCGSVPCVEKLLEYGASMEALNVEMFDVFEMAAMHNHEKVSLCLENWVEQLAFFRGLATEMDNFTLPLLDETNSSTDDLTSPGSVALDVFRDATDYDLSGLQLMDKTIRPTDVLTSPSFVGGSFEFCFPLLGNLSRTQTTPSTRCGSNSSFFCFSMTSTDSEEEVVSDSTVVDS